MYKRLYLNQPVPPDRKSYNLVTHDIEGNTTVTKALTQNTGFIRKDRSSLLMTRKPISPYKTTNTTLL
jgi:hypothetical protein